MATYWIQPSRFTTGAWSPLSLSGLVGWYDATDADSFTFSSGTVVSQWNDLSGNALHLTQATVASQPSRNGTIGGLTAVTFDGVNDLLATSSPFCTAPLTWFAVAYKVGVASSNVDVLIYVDNRSTYTAEPAGAALATWSGAANRIWSTTSTDWSNAHIYVQTRTTNALSAWIDGTNKLNGSAYTDGTDDGLKLGGEGTASQNGDWVVGEIIVCDSVLSATDINLAGNYLERWGMTWSDI